MTNQAGQAIANKKKKKAKKDEMGDYHYLVMFSQDGHNVEDYPNIRGRNFRSNIRKRRSC